MASQPDHLLRHRRQFAAWRSPRILELGSHRRACRTFFIITFFIVLALAVIAFVVFMERAQRRVAGAVPQAPGRQRACMGGDSTHMPLKVNTVGCACPPIFASSLLLIPATIVGFSQWRRPELAAVPGLHCHPALRTVSPAIPGCSTPGLIVFFAYFCDRNVVFNPDETADSLKKNGGFIPGIRPGSQHGRAYFDTCSD